MSPDRLLKLLLADSTRWLGEATFHLSEARRWVAEGRKLTDSESPLIHFYRCIHAFKGACSLMAGHVPVAQRIALSLHDMEGPLAIRDRWVLAESWLPQFEARLIEIRDALDRVRQPLPAESPAENPEAVKAISGGRELVFPWSSVVEFIAAEHVQGRPWVSVQGRLVAVVPSTGAAHEGVFAGVAVKTQSQQLIVVPVQKLEVVY